MMKTYTHFHTHTKRLEATPCALTSYLCCLLNWPISFARRGIISQVRWDSLWHNYFVSYTHKHTRTEWLRYAEWSYAWRDSLSGNLLRLHRYTSESDWRSAERRRLKAPPLLSHSQKHTRVFLCRRFFLLRLLATRSDLKLRLISLNQKHRSDEPEWPLENWPFTLSHDALTCYQWCKQLLFFRHSCVLILCGGKNTLE